MNSKNIFNIAAVTVLLVVAMTVSGCMGRNRGRKSGLGVDQIGNGEIVQGDIPLYDGVRFETLNKVKDVNFYPVYFDYDAFVIPQNELDKISAVADFMAEYPDYVLVVGGHCDERGTNEYNISLGEYRAQSVRNYLIRCGVSADRIQTSSFGEEMPAVDGHTESAWRLNRRAEFEFYAK